MRLGEQATLPIRPKVHLVVSSSEEKRMYGVILVPLDGSERAETILPYVEDIALLRKSTVILLQVIELSAAMITPYDMVPYYDADLATKWLEEAKVYLAGLQGELQAKGITVKVIVEQGPVVRSILDVAAREQVELIAMASHGRTGLGRVFYGSVAAGVLSQVELPLLLVRAQSEE
jgi:nucleotide-binding universal stress UspA family protein